MVRSKRRAFTLIELLVVISIIALLLSILMPGLQKAKQHALRMLCRTNLHSYGIAMNMYLMDNDENFPNPWANIYNEEVLPGETSTTRFCRWHRDIYGLDANPDYQGPLWEYLEAEEINLCPVFAKLAVKYGDKHWSGCVGGPFDAQFGYSQNAFLGPPESYTSFMKGGIAKASEVKSPARTFLFGEENPWQLNTSNPTWNGQNYDIRISTATLNDTSLVARFNGADSLNEYLDAFATFHSPPGGDYNEGTSNVVMMDGSIEAVQPFNDGTFRKSWPALGAKYRPDDRE